MQQKTLQISTTGRGTTNISREVEAFIAERGVQTGLCHIFVHHTSASLMLCENADPGVRRDLERFMAQIAPDSSSAYEHSDEGPDDMPAHIRSVITQSGLTIPITGGRSGLGTWQGVYLWEHRTMAHRRQVTLTVWGS